MSERYATLYRCTAPQTQKNAPIILTAGVLLGDKQTGSVLAQIKLQNICNKVIKAVYASIICVDAMNATIEPSTDARYLDLNVKPGEHFADRQPVLISNSTVRSFTLQITNIMFADGTTWHNSDDSAYVVIPNIDNIYTAEQLEQLRIETGKQEFIVSEAQYAHLKRCCCGQWNERSNCQCVKCNFDFEKLVTLTDPQSLTKKYEERKQAEAERAEQRRIEAERKAEETRLAREKAAKEAAEAAAKAKAKAKAKKKAMILIPSLTVLVVLLAVGTLAVLANNKYTTAVEYMKAGEYDTARTALVELDNYKDSAFLLKELEADVLYANGDYASAYEIYATLPEEYQIHESDYSTMYEYASEMVSAQNFDAAISVYAALGSYKDSVDQLAAVEIARNEALASNYMNEHDYASAREVYLELGYEDLATECLYLLAVSQEDAEPWLAYSNYVELGEYNDSASRAAALYGQRFECISDEDENGFRCYYDPTTQGYGLLDKNYDVFVDPMYSEIILNTYGSYNVCIDDKYGVLAPDGSYLIDAQYESIIAMTGINNAAYYQIESNNTVGLLNVDGSVFVQPQYSSISIFNGIGESQYYQVESDNLVGLLNVDGSVFVQAQYDAISVFEGINECLFYHVECNGKEGLLNSVGAVFVSAEYDSISSGTTGYVVSQYGKTGIITTEGATLIVPSYDKIESTSDGRYLVEQNSLCGIIDAEGNIIIAPEYSSITLENTGTYTVTKNGKYGIVAYDGTVVHEANMEEIKAGSNDGKYLMFRQDGLYGFMDASTFEVIVDAEWKNATIMYDGYAYIYNNLNKWGVISSSGKVTVSPAWSYITYFEDCGCALRSKDGSSSYGQCYLMNSRGSLIMDFSEYDDDVSYLGNGCFIDYYGEVLYDATTATAYAYTVNNSDMTQLRMLSNGLLSGKYRTSSSWDSSYCYGIIDPTVPEILSNIAWEESITVLPCRNISNGKYGWIDVNGKDLIKATYDYIRPFTVNGYIIAANYNDRGNLVYQLLDAATGAKIVTGIATEEEAISNCGETSSIEISLHEKIICSLIEMGFDYGSSEEFLTALLSEDDNTAERLYNRVDCDYGSDLYHFWDDIEYDIDDGELNTEEKVWRRIQNSLD